MAAYDRKPRRWLLLLIAVAAIEIAYVLSVNALLRGDILKRALNSDPERFSVQWSTGWSLVPGRLSLEDLKLAGRTGRRVWEATAATATIQLSLWRLPFDTLRIGLMRADGVAVSLDQLTPTGAYADLSARHEASEALPVVPSSADANPSAPASGHKRGWGLSIGELNITGIEVMALDRYRLTGSGTLQGAGLELLPDGTLSAARASLRLQGGTLASADERIGETLTLNADLRLDPTDAKQLAHRDAARSLSGTIDFSGVVASYGFFDHYLTSAHWLRLGGRGDLTGRLRIDRGKLAEDSLFSVESPVLALELDMPGAVGGGEHYLIDGAGKLNAVVAASDGEPQTRLKVELRDIEARHGAERSLFLTGKAFRLAATGPVIDLAASPAEPSVVIELEDTVMPNVATLNRYLPGSPPVNLASGAARLSGRLAYADGSVRGALDLSGDRIAGRLLDEAVVGELQAAVEIGQADLRSRRFDLSGSHVRMRAARNDTSKPSPLSTEIRFLEARVDASGVRNGVAPAMEQPLLDGVVRLEGTVASVDFLSAFLPEEAGFEVGGDGRIAADLRLAGGRLSPGSRVVVTSDRLFSRMFELEARGSGMVQAEMRSADMGPEILLQVGLHDMEVLRLSDGKAVMRGDALEFTARGRSTGLGTAPSEPALAMIWRDATVPDVAVLDTYLSGQDTFELKCGTARTSGRLDYAEDILSGNLDLTGDQIEGTAFGVPAIGSLDLALVIKRADLNRRRLDLSGTRVRMQAASSRKEKKGAKPLLTDIQFSQAWLQSRVSFAELSGHPGSPPVDGALKLDGTVANIGIIDRFLSGKQRLGFSGDGRLSADLRLNGGRLAPGSAMEIRSANLASRFLDYEAKGTGLLKARITGRPDAPGGDIEATVSNFQFRHLDESTPYMHGRRLDLKTAGKRLDQDNVLRELDTDIQLWEAEIPDMTVYNRYLPQDSGISFVSGTGIVEGGFALKGASGSGDLEMRAKGVEVRIENQTLRGDLRIHTRLQGGNLDEMTFDASGSRIRLDKGSLITADGTAEHGWWGQIDLEEGHLTWRKPLRLDALVGLQLRDSGLLVNLFVKQENDQKWLKRLLTIRNVEGTGRVELRDDSLTLREVRIAGEDFLVLANARLRGEQVEGGLYAKYGILSAAVELFGDQSTWRLLNAREWFDGHTKDFSASMP